MDAVNTLLEFTRRVKELGVSNNAEEAVLLQDWVAKGGLTGLAPQLINYFNQIKPKIQAEARRVDRWISSTYELNDDATNADFLDAVEDYTKIPVDQMKVIWLNPKSPFAAHALKYNDDRLADKYCGTGTCNFRIAPVDDAKWMFNSKGYATIPVTVEKTNGEEPTKRILVKVTTKTPMMSLLDLVQKAGKISTALFNGKAVSFLDSKQPIWDVWKASNFGDVLIYVI